MTVKEWLCRVKEIDKEIKELEEQKENALLYSVTTNVQYGGEKVQTSNTNSNEKKILSYIEYAKKLDESIIKLNHIKIEVQKAIDSVADDRLRILLNLRYIQNRTWEYIADKMYYSSMWVSTFLHNKSLSAIEKYLNEHNIPYKDL